MIAIDEPIELHPAVVPVLAPEKPADLSETGLTADSLWSLILKWLIRGEATGLSLAESLGLPYGILEPLLEHLRAEQLVEVRSAYGAGTAGYRYALTAGGHTRATRCLDGCGYVGVAPVPLAQYAAYASVLADGLPDIDKESVAQAFSDLVVEPEMLDQLGPAITARRALFLYGPPGNGKTVTAEGIGRALGGDIYIPNALDVDGQVIALFDPVVHEPRDPDRDGALIRADDAVDGRWVRIRRPVITVGGELSLEMLDLRFNPLAASYDAPIQLKANGGVLLVDDFGRQRVSPRDLLNRWVVPLESRVDYLALNSGRKFRVPFDVMIVFATNLEPRALADEAFLRRIPYKILAKNPTYEQFCQIFAMNCQRHGLPFDLAHVQYLHEQVYLARKLPMRACHPRDLIDQVVSLCRYRRQAPELSTDLLDAVIGSYFLNDAPTEEIGES